jgi:phosphoribosylglycinamide formyltransferase 2
VILAREEGLPEYSGLEDALKEENTDLRIFGKPVTRAWRRMGVALAWTGLESDISVARAKAVEAASKVKVKVNKS